MQRRVSRVQRVSRVMELEPQQDVVQPVQPRVVLRAWPLAARRASVLVALGIEATLRSNWLWRLQPLLRRLILLQRRRLRRMGLRRCRSRKDFGVVRS